MKSPAKFWSLVIAAVLLVIGLGGWALHLHAKSSLARVKAHLVAAGERLSVEENLPIPVPNEENGEQEFLDAKAMLSALDNKIQSTPMSAIAAGRARCLWLETNAPTREVADLWPDLREHLRTNRPALLKLRAALERPRLQFKVSYGTGFSGLAFSYLGPLKSAAQRLSAVVLLDLRDGNFDEAGQNLRALVAIPARCRDEPLMISELVRAAILAIAAATTWEALQHPGWTQAELAEMQGWWESIPANGSAVRAMSMERALLGGEFARCRDDSAYLRDLCTSFGISSGSSVLDDIGEIGNKALESPGDGIQLFMTLFPRRWAWGPWNSYHDEAWALGAVGNSLRAARDWENGVPYVEIEMNFQEAMREAGKAPPQYLFSATGVVSANERFLQKQALAETQRRMVITAIALRRHKLARGAWPARLDELVPQFLRAVPLDPMDGKSLRYRRAAGGAPLLYSVGTDGADAGGDPRPLTGSSKYWMFGRDIMWPQRASAEEMAEHYRDLDSKREKSRR